MDKNLNDKMSEDEIIKEYGKRARKILSIIKDKREENKFREENRNGL